MKKLFIKIIFLALAVFLPSLAMAEVDVRVNINLPLPPPIIFPALPEVVVIPQTYVYAVPGVDADIFFYGGWWWRPWEGRWYRSRYYDRDWAYYDRTPTFYRQVPSGWRKDYKDRRWKGYEWDERRIPYRDAEKNWRGWKRNKHWEKENNWGVKGMDRRPTGQQKKFNRGNDGPPRGGGPGSKNGSGRGYGDMDKGQGKGNR